VVLQFGNSKYDSTKVLLEHKYSFYKNGEQHFVQKVKRGVNATFAESE
jgi:hypothetical protein